MKNFFKLTALTLATLLLTLSFFACTGPASGDGADDGKTPQPSDNPVNVTFSEDKITADNDSGLSIDASTVTINAPGSYKFTGKLSDGRIIVDTLNKGDVFLILAGIDITCKSSAPIYAKQAKNVYIVLEKGTENKVSDGEKYVFGAGEDEPDAAIFSKDDLFIMGEGSLEVKANYNDGITGKDDVNIESGNITVNAANHGIKGKDSLEIKGGKINVTSAGDGLKSTQDLDASLGFVEINAGDITIKAGDEGIQAYTDVIIKGGNVKIDSIDAGIKAERTISVLGGKLVIDTYDSAFSATKVESGNETDVTVNGKKYEF